jgi:hypothetical protein
MSFLVNIVHNWSRCGVAEAYSNRTTLEQRLEDVIKYLPPSPIRISFSSPKSCRHFWWAGNRFLEARDFDLNSLQACLSRKRLISRDLPLPLFP